MLADEAPVRPFAPKPLTSPECLRKQEHFDFALEELDRGREVEPGNIQALHKKASVCNGWLNGHLARAHYRNLLEDRPKDPETGRCWAEWTRMPGSRPGAAPAARRSKC